MNSSPESPITARELVESGCIHDAHDGVKILGDVRPFLLSFPYRCILTDILRLPTSHIIPYEHDTSVPPTSQFAILHHPSLHPEQGAEQLKVPIHVIPSRASKSAIKAIEAAGGSVFCKYYNQVSLFDCLKGKTDRTSAAPTLRKDISTFLSSPILLYFPPFISSFPLFGLLASPKSRTTTNPHLATTQRGTRTGATAAISHQKVSRRIHWWRSGGRRFRSSCWCSRTRSSISLRRAR